MRSTFSVTFLVGCGALLWACAGGDEATKDAKTPQSKRTNEVEHEPCEGARADGIDVNNDGKPDIRRVLGGNGRELCRVTDLNRNGKPDLFQYFDEAGNLRRREADYDESGVVDAIEHYQGGKLVRVEYDTLAHHKIDTWDFFDPGTGKRVRRERDTLGSGRVNQWWTWEGEKVTIAFDRDGDGNPDPSETITLGDNGAPTPRDAGPPQSTASEVSALDAGSPLTPGVVQPAAGAAGPGGGAGPMPILDAGAARTGGGSNDKPNKPNKPKAK